MTGAAEMLHSDLSVTLARLLERTEFLQRDQARQAEAMTSMSTSMADLAIVKVQQTQILNSLIESRERTDMLERRMAAIEKELPGLRETRRWIVFALISIVGMVGAAVLKVTIVDPAQQARLEAVKERGQ